MKINVLRNFGLNGQDLEAGSTVVVNKSHFGDNEQSFRDEGYFEDHVEPPKEGEEEAPSKPARKKAGEPSVDAAPEAPVDGPA